MSTWSSGGGVGNRSLEMFYYTSTSIFSIQIKKLCGVNKSHKKSPPQIFWFLLSMDFHAGYWTSCLTKTCWIKSFLLTKNIFVHRTRIHKSLSYHRKAGIGSHLIINDKNCIKIFKRQTEQWVLTVLFTSNIKSGFFMKFTQNRNGRQLDFQACKTFKMLKLVYDII